MPYYKNINVLEYNNGLLRVVEVVAFDDDGDVSIQAIDSDQELFVDLELTVPDFGITPDGRGKTGQGRIDHDSFESGFSNASIVSLADGRVLFFSADSLFDPQLIVSNPSSFGFQFPSLSQNLNYTANQPGLNMTLTADPGIPTNGDDIINAGFRTKNLDGDSGFDHLTLDYRGTIQSGIIADRISIDSTNISPESVTVSSGTTHAPAFLNFEEFQIFATSGDDRITLGDGNDEVRGFGGNDNIQTGNGDDTIYAGEGGDFIQLGVVPVGGFRFIRDAGVDAAYGEEGDDNFSNVGPGDILDGGADYDTAMFDLSGASIGVSIEVGNAAGDYRNLEAFYGNFSDGDDYIIPGLSQGFLNGRAGFDRLVLDYREAFIGGISATQVTLIFSDLFAESVTTTSGSYRHLIENFEEYVIYATDGDDAITTESGDDVIYAYDGENSVISGSGSDLVFGGADNDVINLGINFSEADSSIDRAYGYAGDDHFFFVGAEDLIDGGADFDLARFDLHSSTVGVAISVKEAAGQYKNIEHISGVFSQGNDEINAGFAAGSLNGSGGMDTLTLDYRGMYAEEYSVSSLQMNLSDTQPDFVYLVGGGDFRPTITSFEKVRIYASSGDDVVILGNGDDVIWGGLGSDTLNGGGGFDRIDFSAAAERVVVDFQHSSANRGEALGDIYTMIENIGGSSHSDLLRGDNVGNWIAGRGDSDFLDGRGGNDVLAGGHGNDMLIGGSGSDRHVGDLGVDWASYIDSSSGLKVDLLFSQLNNGIGIGDTYSDIENLRGSHFDDNLRGDGGDNRVEGMRGSDFLFGREGDDTLIGGDGDDILLGGIGADKLFGATGMDRASYADSGTGVTADLQNSALNVGDFAIGDTYSQIEGLQGTGQTDDLRGNGLANKLIGANGDDFLTGRNGDDVLIGGNGDDVLRGGNGADLMNGGNGIDQADYVAAVSGVRADLQFSNLNRGIATGDSYISIENLRGGKGNDDLRGDDGDNVIEGRGGNDFLAGRGGDDILRGTGNDDFLNGGLGADFLAGSTGADRFCFNAPEEGGDTIQDFQINVDTLQFNTAGFTSLANGTLSAGNFVMGTAALDTDDFIIYDISTGALYYDADGNRADAAVLIATLQNMAAIDGNDFFLV